MPHGVYTIQNYGTGINCSLSVLFPSTVTLTSINIDSTLTGDQTTRKGCLLAGGRDYVEIRGGHELDPMFMATYIDYCGHYEGSSDENVSSGSLSRQLRVDVGCGNTVLRLVSSGSQENSVSFQLELFVDSNTSLCPRKRLQVEEKNN